MEDQTGEEPGTMSASNSSGQTLGAQHTHDHNYDFRAAFERLSLSANMGFDRLRQAVQLEEKILGTTELSAPSMRDPPKPFVVDSMSLSFLLPFGGCTKDLDCVPVEVSTDGNSLFNAFSVALYGDEISADELQLRTCMEMVLHGESYLTPSISALSQGLEEECLLATKNREFCSPLMMAAAATVISQPIRSVYPPLNGMLDIAVSVLNTTFYPRGLEKTLKNLTPSVVLLWTGEREAGKVWTPDHFVPLLLASSQRNDTKVFNVQRKQKRHVSDISMMLDPLPKSPSVVSNCAKRRLIMTVEFDDNSADFLDASSFVSLPGNDNSNNNQECTASYHVPSSSSRLDPTKETEASSCPAQQQKVEPVFIMKTPASYGMPEGAHPNNGLFLPTPQAVEVLLEGIPTDDKIPDGVKENVYFIIDGSSNIERRRAGMKGVFRDDCGQWQKRSFKTAYFRDDGKGKYTYIEKVGGKFVIGKNRLPLDPQPQHGELYEMIRYYASQKGNPDYRRRVSWFEQVPLTAEPSTCICVEYIGTYDNNIPKRHGNAKS